MADFENQSLPKIEHLNFIGAPSAHNFALLTFSKFILEDAGPERKFTKNVNELRECLYKQEFIFADTTNVNFLMG